MQFPNIVNWNDHPSNYSCTKKITALGSNGSNLTNEFSVRNLVTIFKLESIFFFRKPPGTSKLSIFDVMFDYIEDLWDNLFGEGSKHFLRIYKRSLPLKKDRKLLKTILRNLRILNHRRRKVKRDVYLPSLGIAGEIVNDVANTFINTATVWKYQ